MNPPANLALFFGHTHPLLVHLPIGFLLLLGLLELLARLRRFQGANHGAGIILALAAPAAIFTALCGWLLGQGGGYDPDLLRWHKWTGIATAGICTGAALFYWLDWKRLYRLSLLATIPVLVLASHFGGSLTHGSDYLVRYAPAPLRAFRGRAAKPAPTPAQATNRADAEVFAGVIQPILQKDCVACHGPEKAKAGLRFDSLAAVLKGGENGAVLAPGKPVESSLIKRLKLPPEHDDHMPPDGKPQPGADDIALLEWWVAAGAPDKQKIGELKPPPQIQHILEARAGKPVAKAAPPRDLAAVLPLAEQLTDQLNIAVTALAPNEPWLQCNASLAGTNFGDAELASLAPLAANLRWLDLAGTRVSDTGLVHVAAMPNLVRLHLERTGITDDGLDSLSGLKELEYLNLYATKVTDTGLEALGSLPKLRQLYLWQTGVTPAAAKTFADARVDKKQTQAWQDEIEQLKARIRNQQVSVDLGVTVAAAPKPAPTPVNTNCPVSGKPVDPGHTVVFEGRLIAFCCEKCQAAFEKDPKTYLDKLPPLAKVETAAADPKPVNTLCPVSGKPIDPTKTFVYEGKLVAFCCGDCCAKFSTDPKPYLARLAPAPDNQPKKKDP